MPDPKKGEQVVLVTDRQDAPRSLLLSWAQSHGVPEIAVPKKIVTVDEIPVLGTGKIDYLKVKTLAEEAHLAAQAAKEAPAAPMTAFDKKEQKKREAAEKAEKKRLEKEAKAAEKAAKKEASEESETPTASSEPTDSPDAASPISEPANDEDTERKDAAE